MKDLQYHEISQIERTYGWTKTPGHGRYTFQCPVCSKLYNAKRDDKTTCSPACKQKAHRIEKGRASSYREAAHRGAETKAMQRHELNCQQCGTAIARDGNSASRTKYCSAACKQKAYRESRKD